jgi:hypothetical protein
VTKNLLGRNEEAVLPTSSSSKELAQTFSDFFIDKIDRIRDKISSDTETKIGAVTTEEIDTLVEFIPVSQDELEKVISKSQSKSCELDPIPTWLLKECLEELLPSLMKIINDSLEKAYVPKSFKSSLIKRSGLDANVLKNYRPFSNLPYVSKIHQSAYRKFHSTETALLKVQNDILNSLDRNDLTMLAMLDLSAAFDTIDHTTLLHRLQHHFGIAGKPLEWVTSYLSDHYQL